MLPLPARARVVTASNEQKRWQHSCVTGSGMRWLICAHTARPVRGVSTARGFRFPHPWRWGAACCAPPLAPARGAKRPCALLSQAHSDDQNPKHPDGPAFWRAPEREAAPPHSLQIALVWSPAMISDTATCWTGSWHRRSYAPLGKLTGATGSAPRQSPTIRRPALCCPHVPSLVRTAQEQAQLRPI